MLIGCVTIRDDILRILDWNLHGACPSYLLPFSLSVGLCTAYGIMVCRNRRMDVLDDLHESLGHNNGGRDGDKKILENKTDHEVLSLQDERGLFKESS